MTCIKALRHRMLNLSDDMFKDENMLKFRLIARQNGYPLKLVNAIIHESVDRRHVVNSSNKHDGSHFYRFPFIKNLSVKIRNIVKSVGINLVFYSVTKVSSLFSALKQKLHKLDVSHVVYKVPCLECDKYYIGTTKNKLSARIKQHIADCRLSRAHIPNRTALSSHHFATGHAFDFESVQILDRESNTKKRYFSESLNIKIHDGAVNFQMDTQFINTIYSGLLIRSPVPSAC